jgi:hypothetical protein
MEIVGNDKRIRALFSEAKAADVLVVPGFTAVWHRAEAGSVQPRRSFSFSLAAAVTAMLALTLGSLATWSFYENRTQVRYEAAAELKAPDDLVKPEVSASIDVTKPGSDQTPPRRPMRSRVNRLVVRDQSVLAKNNNAKFATIDSWQSPTAALLTSPAEGLFKSLPQLNENANELKSFLPGRANEKEK